MRERGHHLLLLDHPNIHTHWVQKRFASFVRTLKNGTWWHGLRRRCSPHRWRCTPCGRKPILAWVLSSTVFLLSMSLAEDEVVRVAADVTQAFLKYLP